MMNIRRILMSAAGVMITAIYVLHLITALYIPDIHIYNFILEIAFNKGKYKLDNTACIV